MAAAQIVTQIGEFNPKMEEIETYLARLKIWLTASDVSEEKKVVTTLAVIGPEAFKVIESAC